MAIQFAEIRWVYLPHQRVYTSHPSYWLDLGPLLRVGL